MKNCVRVFLGIAAFLLLAEPSIAQSSTVPSDVVAEALSSTVSSVTAQLQTLSIKWLSAFVLIQFLITNLGLLKSGADLEAVIGKLMGSLLWFGFCFYVVINGSDFIKNVGSSMFDIAGTFSGASGIFSAGYVFEWGFTLSKTLMNAVNRATGSTWFAKLDFMPSLYTFVSCLIIMVVSGLIGFKIFLIKIELMLTIMMSPLSFSFLGLSALKDQGISPFKSLISLIYRVMLLAIIVSVMGKVGTVLVEVFGSVDQGSVTDVWNPVFAGLMAFSLLGYLAFKSDAMAANLASGSTNLGTGDIAAAAALGAAAGAAVATGGASAVAGTAQGSQTMGDFIKSLGVDGTSGSVTNASSSGAGSSPIGISPIRPSMSMGSESQGARNTSPVRPSGSTDSPTPSAEPATVPVQPLLTGESSTNAGIAGAGSLNEQSTDRPKDKASTFDRLKELNQHVAQEKASTVISINTHHTD